MEQSFYDEIKQILVSARNKVYQTANFAMVEAYWNIGNALFLLPIIQLASGYYFATSHG